MQFAGEELTNETIAKPLGVKWVLHFCSLVQGYEISQNVVSKWISNLLTFILILKLKLKLNNNLEFKTNPNFKDEIEFERQFCITQLGAPTEPYAVINCQFCFCSNHVVYVI
jgi:hypothetical protein